MYKENDIVLVRSPAGDAIPPIHVKLIKRIERKSAKSNTMEWKGYVGWECILIKPEEADLLRKKWSIPFKFPDDIETFVFEYDIIKKIHKKQRKKKRKKSHASKT